MCGGGTVRLWGSLLCDKCLKSNESAKLTEAPVLNQFSTNRPLFPEWRLVNTEVAMDVPLLKSAKSRMQILGHFAE